MKPPALKPCISLTIGPKSPEDRQRLQDRMQRLTVEDPRCSLRSDPITGQLVIGAPNELHLEMIVDRLKREWKVDAWVGRPQVVYRAALKQPADGEIKIAREASGGGQYAHVKIRLHPREPGAGYLFENHAQGGAVPALFVPAVDRGVQNALNRGTTAGHSLDDVRAELLDGSYHDLDSSDEAFEGTAFLAAHKALQLADLMVLEPVMRVEAVVPPADLPDVLQTFVSLRGQLQWREERGAMHVATALVPLARLFGYMTDLCSRTQGRGTCSIEFEAYAPVPPTNDDPDSLISVGVRPAPRLRGPATALPEPDGDGVEQ